MELCFIGFPLHNVHQIFFAFSMDQRFDQHQRAAGAGDNGSQQDVTVEDEPTIGRGNDDSSFWSEDTLVEDEDLLSHPGDRKLNGRYQETGLWEVDWATKWEVLMELFKEHELERQDKGGGTESPEGKRFEMLEPYRAALVDDTVPAGFPGEKEDQFARTGTEPDLFKDILVCWNRVCRILGHTARFVHPPLFRLRGRYHKRSAIFSGP